MNNNIENEQDFQSAFEDVRKAYRLIYQLQSRLKDLVFYIKNQTRFCESTDSGGCWRFCRNTTRHVIYQYTDLRIDNIEPWQALPGYIFEYYFTSFEENGLEMSIIQVCDDGYYTANKQNLSKEDILSFRSVNESNSYIILVCGFTGGNWMSPNPETWMRNILNNNKDVDIKHNNDVDIKHNNDKNINDFLAKRYPMYSFSTQDKTDNIIRKFANLVKKELKVNILPSNDDK